MKFPITAVKAGNGVGKTFLAVGLALHFLAYHAPSKVVVCAPTVEQLRDVFWAELESAYKGAAYPLGGKLRQLKLEMGENWFAAGYGSGSIESKSGRHAGHMMAIVDESSGVDEAVHQAIDSLNASRVVHFSNPIRPGGKFHDVCEHSAGNPHVNVITIPSLESPHCHLERSPVGMADRTWLENMRHQWGEESLWWISHILARFPDQSDDGLLKPSWLDLAAATIHVRSGPTRCSIDLAGGNGGDRSVICIRDDNGVLALESSRTWTLEETAKRAAELCKQFRVASERVSWDAATLGLDFGSRLSAVGLTDAIPYLGANAGNHYFTNLRTAAAWAMRKRLNPDQWAEGPGGILRPQAPFAFPRHLLLEARPELLALRYRLEEKEKTALENKDELVKRLRHSPDLADAFMQSFAFPD